MNNKQPIVKIRLSKFNKFLELISFCALALLWIMTIYLFIHLPTVIPIHFHLKGNISRSESKNIIWLFPAIATLLIFGLTLLNKYPHRFNYPVNITEQNAERQYSMATQLIRVIKCSIVLVFIFCVVEIETAAKNKSMPYKGWEIPVILALFFLPVTVYLYSSFKK